MKKHIRKVLRNAKYLACDILDDIRSADKRERNRQSTKVRYPR